MTTRFGSERGPTRIGERMASEVRAGGLESIVIVMIMCRFSSERGDMG
jgi:hypothetical protein